MASAELINRCTLVPVVSPVDFPSAYLRILICYIVDSDGVTQMQMTLVLRLSLHLPKNIMFRCDIPSTERLGLINMTN